MLMRYHRLPPQGFSLLEVLIALTVVTSALLGIFFFQSLALRQVNTAYYQNVAAAQAANLMERFRANPTGGGMEREFTAAQQEIVNFLPQGRYDYQYNQLKRACTVFIFWQDHGSQTFTLSSLI